MEEDELHSTFDLPERRLGMSAGYLVHPDAGLSLRCRTSVG